jgi:hypothetical protein
MIENAHDQILAFKKQNFANITQPNLIVPLSGARFSLNLTVVFHPWTHTEIGLT